jgi:hypothetical protein
MTLESGGMFLAPVASPAGGFHVSTTVIAIVAVIVLVGLVAIIGWRAPDRSPHAEEKIEREEEE